MTNLLPPRKLIVIGASAGGISALHQILPSFQNKDYAVALVIHLPPEGPNLIPSLFKEECQFSLKEAESGEELQGGVIYVAPPGYHLSADPNGTLSLSNEEEINYSRPSIDVLFESASFAYKKSCMAILLTGANHDGAQGLKSVARLGGTTIVQNPRTAEFPVMPESALAIMKPDHILSLEEISRMMRELR